VPSIYLPSPGAVLQSGWDARFALLKGLGVSLAMIFSGFAVGGTIGLITGLMFGYSRVISRIFELTVDVIRPVPLFALIPIFILWLGIGFAPQATIVALGVFLIISLAAIEAIRNVPAIYLRAAMTCGANRIQTYRSVVLPAIVPHILVGLRIAVASAWGLDIAAEYTGSQNGLGYLMIVREQYLDTAGILAIIAIFAIVAIVVDRFVQVLTRRATRWMDRADAQDIGNISSATSSRVATRKRR
jgi:ABC-type nitrate/sulfonate/bicarbonate transport system permease component